MQSAVLAMIDSVWPTVWPSALPPSTWAADALFLCGSWASCDNNCGQLLRETDPSQARRTQLKMTQSDIIATTRTVPGQMVIRVLNTNRVLKLMRFKAPILRDDASENNRLCSSITVQYQHPSAHHSHHYHHHYKQQQQQGCCRIYGGMKRTRTGQTDIRATMLKQCCL